MEVVLLVLDRHLVWRVEVGWRVASEQDVLFTREASRVARTLHRVRDYGHSLHLNLQQFQSVFSSTFTVKELSDTDLELLSESQVPVLILGVQRERGGPVARQLLRVEQQLAPIVVDVRLRLQPPASTMDV